MSTVFTDSSFSTCRFSETGCVEKRPAGHPTRSTPAWQASTLSKFDIPISGQENHVYLSLSIQGILHQKSSISIQSPDGLFLVFDPGLLL